MSYQREFEKRINVALIGSGSHSYRNLLPALNYLPVNLKAVCNRSNIEMGSAAARQYGCSYYSDTEKMYEKEELDAVILCVSPKMHPVLAAEAFDAGLHVMMEKPAGYCCEDVENMIARRKDRICVVGFKKAFMPAAEKAVEVVNSPDFGNLKSILGIYPMSIEKNGREILENRLPGNWLNNGCHPISFMVRIGGSVSAVTVYRGQGGSGGACILEFANGVLGTFHMGTGPMPMERYQLFGDTWHLDIDNCSAVTLQRGISSVYGKTTSYLPEGIDTGAVVWHPQNSQATLENKALFTQGIYAEMKYFCDCVLKGRAAEIGSLEFALELMKIHEAALISDGRRIEIS